ERSTATATDVVADVVVDADVGIITVPDDASALLEAPPTPDFDEVEEWMVDGLTVDQFATEELSITSTTFDTAVAEPVLVEPAVREPEVLEPAVLEPAVLAPAVLEPGVVAEPVRRGTRWSVRDASVLAAVVLAIVAVAGLVFTRGDTPPPTPLIEQQIPLDPEFAAALSAAAAQADGLAPGPDELPVLGPVRLSDADLYERVFTYTGEL
ncbi:MAG: hypothetical protein V7694_26090, partial [Rhodococcus sp. (in: high G+C Gram-positive bacteria)]